MALGYSHPRTIMSPGTLRRKSIPVWSADMSYMCGTNEISTSRSMMRAAARLSSSCLCAGLCDGDCERTTVIFLAAMA